MTHGIAVEDDQEGVKPSNVFRTVVHSDNAKTTMHSAGNCVVSADPNDSTETQSRKQQAVFESYGYGMPSTVQTKVPVNGLGVKEVTMETGSTEYVMDLIPKEDIVKENQNRAAARHLQAW